MALTKIVQCVGLCIRDGRVILGEKVRGKGVGSLNGLGGNYREGQDGDKNVDDTMRREPMEEARIKVNRMEKVGIVEFSFEGKDWYVELHVYRIEDFEGEPVDIDGSDLRNPRFYDMDKIDYSRLWAGDRVWLPMLFAGKKFKGKGLYKEWNELISHGIYEVGSLAG